MESYASIFDEEWVNLSSMFFCDQDSNDFTGHGLFSTDHDHGLNLETPVLLPNANESISSSSCDDQILAYSSDHDIRSDFYNYFPQESSNILDNVCHQSMDVCVMEGDSSNFLFLAQVFSDDAMEENHWLKQDEVVEKCKMENSVGQPMQVADQHPKRKYEMLELPSALEEGNSRKINKKNRLSNDNKNKKNLPPKKMQKIITSVDRSDDDSEEIHHNKGKVAIKNNGRGNLQSSSSCSSEDDSNASQESNEGGIVTVKTRAGRGAATDPQSIYARKRRERINERLRILQTLVPNGTKVDISTMLEEAVHYVKFLQLQINLLSSDDKWMYAPIAYNGVDMGLYNNISPTS